MKKQIKSGMKWGILCLLGTTFSINSCQTDDFNENAKLSNETQSAFRSVPTGNCTDNCIIPNGPYFPTGDSQTIITGNVNNPNHTKTVDVEYYNTETHFVLKVRSTRQWSDLIIGGVSSWTGGPVAANTWGTYTIPLQANWQACDLISFQLKVAGSGNQAIFDVSYNLIGICDDGCETEFIGVANSCDTTREATYTFAADSDQDYIKIQGGLTNFTGSNAVVTVTGGILLDSQRTPGGSSNRVITVEGSVLECESITIHITWNSTNSGGVITGDWSVKDESGIELAPSVPGLQCN
ncbi:MAG: hypothetical protein V4670_01580 [Bacteroidota bacterium]